LIKGSHFSELIFNTLRPMIVHFINFINNHPFMLYEEKNNGFVLNPEMKNVNQ
jgi:hypothetical protein